MSTSDAASITFLHAALMSSTLSKSHPVSRSNDVLGIDQDFVQTRATRAG